MPGWRFSHEFCASDATDVRACFQNHQLPNSFAENCQHYICTERPKTNSFRNWESLKATPLCPVLSCFLPAGSLFPSHDLFIPAHSEAMIESGLVGARCADVLLLLGRGFVEGKNCLVFWVLGDRGCFCSCFWETLSSRWRNGEIRRETIILFTPLAREQDWTEGHWERGTLCERQKENNSEWELRQKETEMRRMTW